MKGFKRKIAGIIIFAMMLSVISPGGVMRVQAADITINPIVIDFKEETVTVSVTGGAVADFYYADVKIKGETTAGAVSANLPSVFSSIKNWELIEENVTSAEMDISWIKKTADTMLYICAVPNGTEPTQDSACVAYAFKKQQTGVKVGMMATQGGKTVPSGTKKENPTTIEKEKVVGTENTGYLYFYTVDKNKKANIIDPSEVEWKKGTAGTYIEVVDTKEGAKGLRLEKKLPQYLQKGATLYFRVKNQDAWYSKEVKYVCKKQANEPSVSIKESGIITLSKGQEYKISTDGGVTWSKNWVDVLEAHPKSQEDTTKAQSNITVNELKKEASGTAIGDAVYEGNVVVKVRTAATNTKVPSKVKTLKIYAVSASAIVFGTVSGTAQEGTVSPENATVKVGYKAADKKYVNVVNKTDADIEYAVLSAEEYEKVKDNLDVMGVEKVSFVTKWTMIYKDKTGSILIEKLSKGSVILARTAGTKENKRLNPPKPVMVPNGVVVYQVNDLLYPDNSNPSTNINKTE